MAKKGEKRSRRQFNLALIWRSSWTNLFTTKWNVCDVNNQVKKVTNKKLKIVNQFLLQENICNSKIIS